MFSNTIYRLQKRGGKIVNDSELQVQVSVISYLLPMPFSLLPKATVIVHCPCNTHGNGKAQTRNFLIGIVQVFLKKYHLRTFCPLVSLERKKTMQQVTRRKSLDSDMLALLTRRRVEV